MQVISAPVGSQEVNLFQRRIGGGGGVNNWKREDCDLKVEQFYLILVW